MDNKENKKFLISVESYKNEDLDLFLTLEIKAQEEDQFKAYMELCCSLKIANGLYVKDVYTKYLDIHGQKNTILPENEIDFFNSRMRYKVDRCCQATLQLAEQVKDFIKTLIFERIEFKMIINAEENQCSQNF